MEIEKKASKKNAKKSENAPKIASKTDTSKFYELGYIFVPSITEDRVRVEEKVLADLFTKAGGEIISSEPAVLIDLAYPMLKVIHAHREKCDEGYFGWMKFEIETDAIVDIKKALDGSEFVLRYLLTKTVRENTLLNGKMNLVKEKDMRKIVADEVEVEEVIDVPANPEELDKSIDDLVIA